MSDGSAAVRYIPRIGGLLPLLQAFDKLLQASVIRCGVVPEAGVSGRQHPNLCAAHAIHLPINNSGFNNCIVGTMSDQHGFAELRQ